MPLRSVTLIIVFTIIVFEAATILIIVSISIKLNFLDKFVIQASLYSIIMSGVLDKILKKIQVDLLDELDFEFSVIGVSETKINGGKILDFDLTIPGYVFAYIPTPLASRGVSMYINAVLKY